MTDPGPYRGPLTDVRVVDLTRVLAGPYATNLLADLGADVVKVEAIAAGDPARMTAPLRDGVSYHFANLNRNKRSIAMDLKHPDARATLLELVAHSDVLIENFRPGVMARLGLDHAVLRERSPSLVICSISGYGQDSSYADKPSYDIIGQALSGAMSVTGEPGRPPVRMGMPIGDLASGLFAAIGILAALQERHRSGEGQRVDVSMLDALTHLMLYYNTDYANAGTVAGPVGGRHEHVAPYGVFAASDGHLVVATFSDKFWQLFCGALERPDLLVDPRFERARDRVANREELYRILDAVLLTRTSGEWIAAFEADGIPCAPILAADGVAALDVLAEREMFVTVDHPVSDEMVIVGRPIKLPDRVVPPLAPGPGLGEHTVEVLRDVAGLEPDAVERLIAAGAVAANGLQPARGRNE